MDISTETQHFVFLDSLPDAMCFYVKQGFKLANSGIVPIMYVPEGVDTPISSIPLTSSR
jgi:hypothetical protein